MNSGKPAPRCFVRVLAGVSSVSIFGPGKPRVQRGFEQKARPHSLTRKALRAGLKVHKERERVGLGW
jgi:hypothetical protein